VKKLHLANRFMPWLLLLVAANAIGMDVLYYHTPWFVPPSIWQAAQGLFGFGHAHVATYGFGLIDLVTVAPLLLFLLAWLGNIAHSRRLCEFCIARWPLNAEEQASKKGWQFGYFHRCADALEWIFGHLDDFAYRVLRREPSRLLQTLLYMLLIELVLLFVPGGLTYDLLWGFGVNGACALIMITTNTHMALHPWCPYCRGGDGDEVLEPEPDPSVTA
jgi:hypothetical protein